jgi:hypothetical protein
MNHNQGSSEDLDRNAQQLVQDLSQAQVEAIIRAIARRGGFIPGM